MKGFKELSLVALSLLAHTINAESVQVPIGSESPTAKEKVPQETTAAETEEPVKSSDVHILGGDNFDSFIEKNEMVFAEFYAPWCGHCQKLEPHYEKAATELKEHSLHLAKVDCTVHKDLCEKHEVKGFPTLKLFKNGKPRDYNSARESQAIVDYMILMSKPATTKIEADKHDEFSKSHKIVVVAYLKDDDLESHATFSQVAEQLRDSYVFGTTNHDHHADAATVKFPSVVLYKQYDEGKNIHEGEITVDELIKFTKTSATPFVGEIGPETYADYMDAGIHLAYIFYENDEQKDKYVELIKPLAKKFKGKINFGTINAVLYGAHAPNLNLKQEPWPAFAIQDTVKNFKYPFNQDLEFTDVEITKFVENFSAGKIQPTIKSEPVPEKQEGPVHVVVANNFEDIVMDNDKDVFVEFYAPHCGHCMTLKPKYEELGGLYFGKKDLGSKVVIAKFDCMNNDLPPGLEIQGFPTLKIYPAGGKDSPVEYTGDRSVADMAKFVLENGSHKVKVSYVASEEEKKGTDEHDEFDEFDEGAVDDESEDSHENIEEKAESVADKVKDKVKEAVDAASDMLADDEDVHDEL